MSRADEILAQADPLYFFDYALFTGAIRHHAAKTFEDAFKADPNPIHRRLHIVNLIKEEYAAYEDAGSMLDAFLAYREGTVRVPLARLIQFKARDVELARVFESHQIASGDELRAALRPEEWIPPRWEEWFPQLDLPKALHFACRFFAECRQTQTLHGVLSYNKIKHGLLIVPSANAYKPDLPDAPAAFFPNTRQRVESGASPYAMAPFDMSNRGIETRYSVVEFIQCNLRLLAGLYVTWRYPDSLRRRGVADPYELFACQEFYDMRHLIEEVTLKK